MATKLRLHNTPSSISGYKSMDLALGPLGATVASAVTNTAASGTDIQCTATAAGATLAWISEPIATIGGSGSGSISGTLTFNVYGSESSLSANTKFRGRLYKYSGGSEGSAFATVDMAAEFPNTTLTAARNWTGTPTSTTFAAGDRIVFKLFITNAGTMASGFTVTAHYDGATDAADGSSWAQLNESVTFAPEGGAGGTPTVIRGVRMSNLDNSGQPLLASGVATVPLPHATGAGNAVIVCMMAQRDTGANPGVPTITDDGGNTYQVAVQGHPDGNYVFGAYALNVASGSRVISISFPQKLIYFTATAMEVTNIATASALDATSINLGVNSDTIDTGTITPTVSGDFVVNWAWNGLDAAPGTVTPGTGWTLETVDSIQGQMLQDRVYGSTSALAISGASGNAMTQSTSGTATYYALAMAFKASAAGTAAPSGIQIYWVHHHNIPFDSVSPHTAHSYTFQIPVKGNLLVDMFSGGGLDELSGTPTVSPTNTVTIPDGAVDSSGANFVNGFYIANPALTSGQVVISLTQAKQEFDDTHMFYDIKGADTTSPCTGHTTATGSQTGTANWNTVTSFTPGNSNGLILCNVAVDFDTVASTPTTGALLQNGVINAGTANNTANTPYDQNNGWQSLKNAANTAVTFGWGVITGLGANVGNWSSQALAFQAASTGFTITADSGSITETGTAAILKTARLVTAAAGTYTETGTVARLLRGYRVPAASAAFAETGTDVFPRVARLLSVAPGSVVESGTAARLLRGYKVPASSGAYSESGIASNLLIARLLQAGVGSVLWTGIDATLTQSTNGLTLVASPGSFNFSGVVAALLAARKITVSPGSYVVTGTAANLTSARRLTVAAGSYAFAGTAVQLLAARKLAAGVGLYTITGINATLFTNVHFVVKGHGPFPVFYSGGLVATPALTGRASTSTYSGTLTQE